MAEFNAVHVNTIQIYPLSAKQYINGSWANVIAKSYQNGNWVDWWKGDLFDNGNLFDGMTGGWVTGQHKIFTDDGISNGTVTIGNTIKLAHAGIAASTLSTRTKNKIELSKFSTIRIEGVKFGYNCFIFVDSDESGLVTAYGTEGASSLDIHSLTGYYYVGVAVRNGSTLEVKKIYME